MSQAPKLLMGPKFYTIFPDYIRLSRLLSPLAKLLFCEISLSSQPDGMCYDTDKYLANRLHVTDRTLRTYLTELREAGFIKVERSQTLGGRKRKITIMKE